MSRILSLVARLSLGLLAVGLVLIATLLVLAVAVPMILDQAAVRERLRPRLEQVLSDALGAQASVGAIRRIDWPEVELADVRLATAGKPVIEARDLVVHIDLSSLLPPRLGIVVRLDGLALTARQAADGSIDLVDLFVGGEDQETEAGGTPAWLEGVTLRLADSRVRFERAGEGVAPIVLADIDGAAEVGLAGGKTEVSVDRLTARLQDASQLALKGDLALGPPSSLDAELTVDPLASADLIALGAPGDLEPQHLRAVVKLTGSLEAPQGSVQLASDALALDAKLVRSGPEQRSTALTWELGKLAPAGLMAGAPQGEITGQGRVTFTADGPLPSEIPSDLNVHATFGGTSVEGVAVEKLEIDAHPEGKWIVLDVDGALPGGAATVQVSGRMGLEASDPVHVTGSFAVADPKKLPAPASEALADTEIGGTFEVSAPTRADAASDLSARVTLASGKVRGIPIEHVQVVAEREGDLVRLEEARVKSGATALEAAGSVELSGAQRISATLSGPVDLASLDIGGRGRLSTSIALDGSLTALNGKVEVSSEGPLELPEASVQSIRITSELSDLGSETPSAHAKITGRAELTGGAASFTGPDPGAIDVEASWRREPGAMPTDQVELDASATFAAAANRPRRQQRVELSAAQSGDTTRVNLRELALAPAVGPPWRLRAPAQITVGPQQIAVDRAVLETRGASVQMAGVLQRQGAGSDFRVNVDDVALGTLCELAAEGAGRGCAGRVNLDLAVSGSLVQPSLRGALDASGLRIDDFPYGDLRFTAETRAQRLEVRGSLTGPHGRLSAQGGLPLRAGEQAPQLDPGGAMDLAISVDGVELAGLETLTGRAVTDLAGELSADVDVGGTVSAPRVNGTIRADGVRMRIAATGATFADGRLAVDISPTAVRIRELDLAQGRITAGGAVGLSGFQPTTFDVWLAFDGARVVQRSDARANLGGRIAATGTWSAPRVAGALTVESAVLRPAGLGTGSRGPAPDPTIQVIRDEPKRPRKAPRPQRVLPLLLGGGAQESPAASGAGPTFYDRLAIDIPIKLRRVSVERIDAFARLAGDVRVLKERGDELALTGSIEASRGWYMFQGRRLNLDRAVVTFAGGMPPNPDLDVLALSQVGDYEVRVQVQGTVSEPALVLSSSPALDESDILSLLLFGQTTSGLRGGQEAQLQQQAVGLLASYVAPELQSSLQETLGLASITFAMPSGDRAGSVGVGRYIGEDIFVSLAQDFGGPSGGTDRQLRGLVGSSVTVQYYVSPQVTVQGASSSQGESAVDVIWHRRY